MELPDWVITKGPFGCDCGQFIKFKKEAHVDEIEADMDRFKEMHNSCPHQGKLPGTKR